MTDAHCHLDSVQFKGVEINQLIADVDFAISCGANVASSARCVLLARQNDQIYAAVGLGYEPVYSRWGDLKKELLALGQDPKTVAIGECGIDSDNPKEDDLLKFHLELARELDLPLIIHNRHRDDRVHKILGSYPKVMMHCFTGTYEQMMECVEKEWYISFGGILTFKKSHELRSVANAVPEDKLLIETDAPYLSPEPVRGDVNYPTNVKIIAEALAQIRGVTLEEIGNQTQENALRLFSKITHGK